MNKSMKGENMSIKEKYEAIKATRPKSSPLFDIVKSLFK